MGITGTFEGAATNPCYLFNNGSYAGGQSGIGVSNSFHNFTPSISNSIKGNILNSSGGAFRFNNVQNLSNYKYLKMLYNLSGRITSDLAISNNPNVDGYSASLFDSHVNTSTVGTNMTLVLDISSISGNYWIYITVSGNSHTNSGLLEVFQIYLSTT